MAICRVCRQRAAVRLKYANLALCKQHFIEYFERRIFRTIKKYNMMREGDRVAVAVSGGKDSVALLYALSSLREKLKVELMGITIDLGIKGYSERCVQIAVRHYEHLSIPYEVVDVREYGFTVDELKGLRRSPCSACGVIKRYLLNKVSREMGARVLATGHNLDDFLAVVLQAYIRGDLRLLSKLKPSLPPIDGLIAKVKPLVETHEKDALLYVLLRGLEYMEEECPYAVGATSIEYKALLNQLEDKHPGIKLQMLRAFLDRIQPLITYEEPPLAICEKCGEPSSGSICQFCRLLELSRTKLAKNRCRKLN